MSRVNTRMARARRKTDRTTQILVGAFFIAASITAVLAFILLRNLIVSWGAPAVGSGAAQGGGTGSADSLAIDANVPRPTGPLQRDTDPTPVPWDGNSRLTILVMGLDFRDWSEDNDIPRTDSMILASIDPASKTVGMLSIPRDMWVNVPGMGNNKINTAYRWGEAYQTPGGGPALAMQTVEEFIEMPVDYYALIDFNAFVSLIDEMGGLDMHIKEEIVVDPVGPGNTRTLEPGVQTLDGATVLAYARQRYAGNDDFDRSRRQQEVIMAIREQVLQFNMLPTLIAKAPRLYQQVAAGITTNLTLDQIIRLALLGAQVPEGNIRKDVIGPPNQVEITTNPEDGQSILLPIPDQIRIVRDSVFSSDPLVNPAAVEPTAVVLQTAPEAGAPETTSAPTEPVGDPLDLMKAEKARVMIKNGTYTAGLAAGTGDMLKGLGFNVIGEENADQKFENTVIYDYTGSHPNTIKVLIEQLHVSETHVYNRFDPEAPADIEIILGFDWSLPEE